MTIRYMTGESREDEERRNCHRCDVYRGYVCAEHRPPSYEEMSAELEGLKAMAPCGHQQRFTDWEYHGKPITCAMCEIERLRAELEERDRLIQRAMAHWQSLHWGATPEDVPGDGVPIDKAMAAAVNTITRLRAEGGGE